MGLVHRAQPLNNGKGGLVTSTKFDLGADIFMYVGTVSANGNATSRWYQVDHVNKVTVYVTDNGNATGVGNTITVTLYGVTRDGTAEAIYSGNGPAWINAGRQTFDVSKYQYLYTYGVSQTYAGGMNIHCCIGSLCDDYTPYYMGAEIIVTTGTIGANGSVSTGKQQIENVQYITAYTDNTNVGMLSNISTATLRGVKTDGTEVDIHSASAAEWASSGRQTFDVSEYSYFYLYCKNGNTTYTTYGTMYFYIGSLCDDFTPAYKSSASANSVSQISPIDIANTVFEFSDVTGGYIGKNFGSNQLYLSANKGNNTRVYGKFTSTDKFYIDFNAVNFASISVTCTHNEGRTIYANGKFIVIDEYGNETVIFTTIGNTINFNKTQIKDISELGLKSGYYKLKFDMYGDTHVTGHNQFITYFSIVNNGILFF